VVLLAALAPCAPARQSDRNEPANIEADRAQIDRPAGVSHYYGDVVFTQGTLRITGDTVTVRAPDGGLQYAESHGNPATARQETETGEVVHANAQTIVYDADAGLVTLTGDAELLREGERFAAGEIRYRTDTGRIEAERGSGGDRVHIRIEPRDDGAASQ